MSEGGITILLRRVSQGDQTAQAELFECVYAELKRQAAYFLRTERPNHTLQPTALVNEAYLRLSGKEKLDFADRNHFFAVSAQVMRHLLVDSARRYRSKKRDGGPPVPLDENMLSAGEPAAMEELDQALERLAIEEPRAAKVVELRHFGGMTFVEIAQFLNLATKTVQRDWKLARALLRVELSGGKEPNTRAKAQRNCP